MPDIQSPQQQSPISKTDAPVTPPNEPLYDFVDDNGQAFKLTGPQLVERAKTYVGKASQFDATAKEKAALAAELESLKPKVAEADEIKSLVGKLRTAENIQQPDWEAMERFINLTLSGKDREDALAHYRTLKMSDTAGASPTQPQGKASAGAGQLPPELLGMFREQQKQIAQLTEALKATQDTAIKVSQWRETQEESVASQTIKQYIIDKLPQLGNLISHPKGATILTDVTTGVLADRKASGVPVSPQLVEKHARKWLDILTAVDEKYPRTHTAEPSLFGVAPIAPSTSRFAGATEQPNYSDYAKQGKSMSEFMRDLAEYHSIRGQS